MTNIRFVETDAGSLVTQSGGLHGGQTTITMLDGSTFAVAHSVPEVLTKIGTSHRHRDYVRENFPNPGLFPAPTVILGAVIVGPPDWVSFDAAGSLAGTFTLNVNVIKLLVDPHYSISLGGLQ